MTQPAGVTDLGSRTGEQYVPYRAASLLAFVLEATRFRMSNRLRLLTLATMAGVKQLGLYQWRPHLECR